MSDSSSLALASLLALVVFLHIAILFMRSSTTLSYISRVEWIGVAVWLLVCWATSVRMRNAAIIVSVSLMTLAISFYIQFSNKETLDNRQSVGRQLLGRSGLGVCFFILAISCMNIDSLSWIGLLILFPPIAWYVVRYIYEDFYRNKR